VFCFSIFVCLSVSAQSVTWKDSSPMEIIDDDICLLGTVYVSRRTLNSAQLLTESSARQTHVIFLFAPWHWRQTCAVYFDFVHADRDA